MNDVFVKHAAAMAQREKELEAEGIKIFRLSTTERQEFKECRRKWDLSSLSRQGLEPKRPATSLWFGTLIHYGLEVYYRNRDNEQAIAPWDAFEKACRESIEEIKESQGGLWEEQIQELEESIELGVAMLRNYVDWAEVVDFKDDTGFAKVIATEQEFAVPIQDPEGNPARFRDGNGQVWELWLVGRFDMVVEDYDGRLWLVDHKTSKDKLDPEILILDDQMTVYLWAAQQIFGKPFEGVYYNVLRKKLPTVPPLVHQGKQLSKAKNIDTTYEVYYAEIEKHGFDPSDYKEILEILENKPNTFFQREKVRRNQHEISMAGLMLYMEGIDMLNDPYIYTNPTWDCRWKCDFKELCKAINRNDDVEWMKNAMFRKRVAEGVYAREKTIEEDVE